MKWDFSLFFFFSFGSQSVVLLKQKKKNSIGMLQSSMIWQCLVWYKMLTHAHLRKNNIWKRELMSGLGLGLFRILFLLSAPSSKLCMTDGNGFSPCLWLMWSVLQKYKGIKSESFLCWARTWKTIHNSYSVVWS